MVADWWVFFLQIKCEVTLFGDLKSKVDLFSSLFVFLVVFKCMAEKCKEMAKTNLITDDRRKSGKLAHGNQVHYSSKVKKKHN